MCDKQLLDVQSEDLLYDGLYRKCNVYKSGGGYDKFSEIYYQIFGQKVNPIQFVVQLRGCPLSCDYCYVTPEGIWGQPVFKTTRQLLEDFYPTNCQVFHLMGGAPALYLEHWRKLARNDLQMVFHSDFVLVEKKYKLDWLKNLPGLFAVSLKKEILSFEDLIWHNLDIIRESGIAFYLTFTGGRFLESQLKRRYGKRILENSFDINIIRYKALGKRNVEVLSVS